jgi:hypothetical protein
MRIRGHEVDIHPITHISHRALSQLIRIEGQSIKHLTMANRVTIRSLLYYTFYTSEWVTGIMVVLFTLLVSQDAKEYSLWPLPKLILWSQGHKLSIFAFAAIAVVTKFAREQIGPPWAWKAIKELIDTWQGKIFAGIPHASVDEHRITIFRRVHRWRPLRGWRYLKLTTGNAAWWRWRQWPIGWFKPMVRSQHVSQRNITWFPCFDAARIGEGFVGLVWRTSGTLRTPTLPDLNPPLPNLPTNADYQEYARQTRTREPWLRARQEKINARTLCGTKIEKNGSNWGVIIIDSRSTNLTVNDDQVEFVAAALGKLIERA